MDSAKLACPYVGLRPFRESDRQYFFGRDRDIRVISSNMQTRPLTVLYGPSGVGKSSVLQAGVLPQLSSKHPAVLFSDWQNPFFLNELTERCRRALPGGTNAGKPLDEMLQEAGRFFLLLDQFEEFLMYHAEAGAKEFDVILSRIINREDVLTRVLIGIREDALSKLDQRFGMRILNLLGNMLALQQLDMSAARSAIREPLGVLNSTNPQGGSYSIEPELVTEILHQVQAGRIVTSESTGLGSAATRAQEIHVESAFLQLVLTRLWMEEAALGSNTLRLQTLSKIGGAGSILQRHVDDVMGRFATDRDRDIAASMFRHLVTPSRTKIAQAIPDLVAYAEAPLDDVQSVLSVLSDRPEARILRRLSKPDRYEIFHDVLAQPILDWRRGHLLKVERDVEERRQAEEVRRHRHEVEQARALARAEQRLAGRLRWLLGALAFLLVLALGVAIYASRQRQQVLRYQESEAIASQNAELAAQQLAAALKAQAELNLGIGDAQEAARLRRQAEEAELKAKKASEETSQMRAQMKISSDGEQRYRDALKQIDNLKNSLAAAEDDRQQLRAQIDQLKRPPPVSPGPSPSTRVTLIAPTSNAVISQDGKSIGCTANANQLGNNGHKILFQWEVFPGASSYHLYAKNRSALKPIVDAQLVSTSYTEMRCGSFVINANLDGWEWRVEAFDNAKTRIGLSETRVFRFQRCVLPDGSDCRTRPRQ